MTIVSNAASDEFLSPFYKKNELFCKEFENYINKKQGEVTGKYNAWSYEIIGKIHKPTKWILKYKKSTLTSTGSLWLSSKKQNLIVTVEWSTRRIGSHNSEFEIRRKRKTDIFSKLWNKDISDLNLNSNYVIRTKFKVIEFVQKIGLVLDEVFKSGEIYTIIYKNDLLFIKLQSEKHHFDLFEELLEV